MRIVRTLVIGLLLATLPPTSMGAPDAPLPCHRTQAADASAAAPSAGHTGNDLTHAHHASHRHQADVPRAQAPAGDSEQPRLSCDCGGDCTSMHCAGLGGHAALTSAGLVVVTTDGAAAPPWAAGALSGTCSPPPLKPPAAA